MKRFSTLLNTHPLRIIIFLHILVSLILFGYTIKIRRPWFGTFSLQQRWQLNLGISLLFTKIWYREGIFKSRFAMIERPDSIEFPGLQSRKIYASYPSGSLIPVFLLSKIRGHEPTIGLIMKYNLANHFLMALCLCWLIFFLLRQIGCSLWQAFWFSLIPLVMVLLLPGPLYYFQNVYFAEQAFFLPYIMVVLLEILRDYRLKQWQRRIVNLLQAFLFFYGTLIGWLFIPLALIIYLKRIISKEIGNSILRFIKKSFIFWLPVIIALCLFALQLYLLNAFPLLQNAFQRRSDLGRRGEAVYQAYFYQRVWLGYVGRLLGSAAVFLIRGSWVIFLLSLLYAGFNWLARRSMHASIKKLILFTGILILPIMIHLYLLKSFVLTHEFTALRFLIPLATIPFILLPILMSLMLRSELENLINRFRKPIRLLENIKQRLKNKRLIPVGICCLLLLAFYYTLSYHPEYSDLFKKVGVEGKKLGEFVDLNTRYEDIVFSDHFNIKAVYDPTLIFSMKWIYRINSLDHIYKKVKDIKKEYIINILRDKQKMPAPWLKKLISTAYDVRKQKNLVLYKIKKDVFLKRLIKYKDL